MEKNPEQTAWIMLWLAFIIFCSCALSIPFSIRWYVLNKTDVLSTQLTSIRGTVLVKPNREDQAIPVTHSTTKQIEEKTVITTDNTSQAILTFFDKSSITLYNNTILVIQKSEQPRFRFSSLPKTINVEILRGRIRVNTSITDVKRLFTVKSPHAQAILDSGSYAIETSNENTKLTTRSGIAYITAQEETVTVAKNQLSTITENESPALPTAAEQNLLTNGDFSKALSDSWVTTIFVPSPSVTSTVRLITMGGRSVVEFNSRGEDNIHTESSIQQDVNKDVQDSQILRISADIRLNYQSLPGGGQIGTEFPIMIQLAYRDIDGNDQNWFHGFYYEPPPENYIIYTEQNNSSENISQYVWYPYESENLLEIMGALKPEYVKYIRIYASGWIYNAMVADVQLLAQD